MDCAQVIGSAACVTGPPFHVWANRGPCYFVVEESVVLQATGILKTWVSDARYPESSKAPNTRAHVEQVIKLTAIRKPSDELQQEAMPSQDEHMPTDDIG